MSQPLFPLPVLPRPFVWAVLGNIGSRAVTRPATDRSSIDKSDYCVLYAAVAMLTIPFFFHACFAFLKKGQRIYVDLLIGRSFEGVDGVIMLG